ncbi:hypothetical protein ACFP1I_00960 [Dyadobacter subterraneus]|uniref:CcmD family protein n=1 Tax=Dyadobacter subterraneus TaxID=2773304 RepID=A0ABR9W775_9BACT|nr:hypothetical protein [Dyadobacter subterraneus]MBE9461321.1 hypothetical protein [Dyadobacter subterraneus]
MKNAFLLTVFIFMGLFAAACPVCDQRQPKLLQGIAHGLGPESNWDYLIVSVAAVIVILTLFYSAKMLIKPGEKSDDHIKRLVINI